MPARNEDLHGFVPDKASVALLLIDVINDPAGAAFSIIKLTGAHA